MALEQHIQTAVISKAKKGDETALELLYNSYSKAMFSICLRMVAAKDDAEDVLQEVFIIAFKNINQLKDDRQFGGWLKRIAVNECIRFCKKRLQTNNWEDIYVEEKKEEETHWWQEVSLSALHTEIRKLPDGCRQVFNLYAIEDYSHKEIASSLNISESTSKSQYHRARKLLKEQILIKIKTMDELKKYLQTNASSFEDELPDVKVWQNIRHKIQPQKNKRNLFILIARYSVAACIIFLAGIGVWHLLEGRKKMEDIPTVNQLAIIDSNNQKDTEISIQETLDTPLAVITSTTKTLQKILLDTQDLAQNIFVNNYSQESSGFSWHQVKSIDSQFSQIINVQKNIINHTPFLQRVQIFFRDFFTSYQQMENDEITVKKDIKKIGLSKDLLEQLIYVNQQKLNLLKQLLIEMNKTNIRFKQNRNLLDTIKTYFIEI